MNKKHTGGQWTIVPDKAIDQKKADQVICTQQAGNSKNIARIIRTLGMTEEEYKANAELIARAPAMDEALTVIKAHLISSKDIVNFDHDGLLVPKTDMLLYIDKVLGIDQEHGVPTDHNQEQFESVKQYTIREHTGTEILSFVRNSDGCYFEKGQNVELRLGHLVFRTGTIACINASESHITGLAIKWGEGDDSYTDAANIHHIEITSRD